MLRGVICAGCAHQSPSRITLKHETFSCAVFAEGALAAAEFLMTRGPGLYDMKSLLGD